jgi:hypothetical protein
MKKIVTSVFTLALLFGAGTGAMAASEEMSCKVRDFKEMLPMMAEKHPELSEKELKNKHKECVKKMKAEENSESM